MIDRKRAEENVAYKEEMRLKCQTDLLFLARLLGYDKVLDRVHGPVAALCVQKNPGLPIEQQSDVKVRIHLDPRGTYKTTMSIVDCVQWIICFPNIRICIMTATKPLGVAMVGEITDHFVKPKIADATDLQFLFPEFCIDPSEKMVGQYTAPNRTRDWREKTVMAFSIEASISGWHFDVFVPDDAVDTQNSSTPQGIEKTKKNYRINKKTLMPYGYINYKDTRYDPFDLSADMLEKAKPGKTKVLVRAALKLKDGRRLEPGEFPAEDEVELLFPELLSYEFLKTEFEDDYSSFMTQYMNDAHGGHEVTFEHETMLAAVVATDDVPISGQVFMAWRFACAGNPKMKYAAGAAGIMDGGRMYIVDAVRGSFKPSALAHKVVHLAKKHGVHAVSIEETPGAKAYLESAIQNYAATLGWHLSINWLEYQEDEGARDLRVKGMEPVITAKRIVFSDKITAMKEVYQQFCNYDALENTELPDVISRVSANLPASIVPMDADAEQDLNWELAVQRDMHDRTHGLGSYAPAAPLVEEKPYTPPANSYGLPEELGGLNG